ncbi:MAG: ATP synthase subunit I [Verrucomicrobia bacterium]|nr:ATP synthase subunit I [Verrucomicrobiota bacterium]
MNEPLMLVVAGAVGLVLGAVFFGGLWWTVRQGVSSPRPALWFVGSMLLRTGIVLAGFYFVGGGQWQRLLVCLLGFVIARFLVMRLTRTRVEHGNFPAKEAHPLKSRICSLSSPKGEGRGEEAQSFPAQIPSPQPSPRSGGERESEVRSRCATSKEASHAP